MISEYMLEVGIPENLSVDEIYDRLEIIIGIPDCMKLERILDARYNGSRSASLYKHINKTLDGSITFFGGFDASFLRNLFGEIEARKNQFGERILDVGCNNGMITCFLAKCFPESHVIGIDSEWEGINIARQLAEKLGLSNVEFQQKNFLKVKRSHYDTIFMSKVVQEIEIIEPKDWSIGREGLVKEFRRKFSNIAKRISMNLAPDGTFFSIERIPYNIATYGYCLALHDAGLSVMMDEYKRICFMAMGETERMPLVIAKKENGEEGPIRDVFEKILDEEEKAAK